jgi:hypothetical protein
MVKRLSVYGDYQTTTWVPTKQRTWTQRVDGIWQRYWYKTRVQINVEESGRYEFYGTGKDLAKAVRLARARAVRAPRFERVMNTLYCTKEPSPASLASLFKLYQNLEFGLIP